MNAKVLLVRAIDYLMLAGCAPGPMTAAALETEAPQFTSGPGKAGIGVNRGSHALKPVLCFAPG
jgi:hypothetical protein